MVTDSINFHDYFIYDNGRLIRKNNGDTAGYLDSLGYTCLKLKCKTYKAHRVIFHMHYGYMPKYIDHINGVRNDNRIENLREATPAQNGVNSKTPKNNRTGVKGVCFKHGKYEVSAKLNGVYVYLGRYDTLECAKTVRHNFIKINHGEFARYD